MADEFKIQNIQLYKWSCADGGPRRSKESHIIAKIQENYDFNQQELGQILKKLKRNFLPHLKNKMKACKYIRKDFEKYCDKFLSNFFVVKFVHD